MPNDTELRQLSQWILERNLQWIAAADAKTGVIVAINTGMLGALAAIFGATPTAQRTAFAILFTTIAALMLGMGIICAAMALFPRTQGPTSRYFYFGGIAEMQMADFTNALRNANPSQLFDDLAAQVHRNAQIASAKFGWVRKGMIWSFVGLIPWIAALACLKK